MVGRSSSQLVLLIMVMVLALEDCDASKGIKKVVVQARNGVMVPGIKYMNNAKEMFTIPQTAEDKRGKLGGRKMMAEAREVSNEVKKEESKKTVSTAEAPKISGRKDLAKTPVAGSLMNMDDQNDAAKRPDVVPNSEHLCSHECAKGAVSNESDNDSFQKLDSKKLLEAASQMVSLMNKDYPGGGGPGYRPPINNHEPLH